MSCTICHQNILTGTQRYLIDGTGKWNVRELLSNLPFAVTICSLYVCKSCLAKLKKRQVLKKQEAEILEEIKNSASLCGQNKNSVDDAVALSHSTATFASNSNPDNSKRFRADFPTSPILISPVKACTTANSQQLRTPVACGPVPLHSTPIKRTSSACLKQPTIGTPSPCVSVKVQWPSETRERTLNPDMESLGKMLIRGTYKQIAKASWQNPKLRKELRALALKDIDKECHALCSRKRPSCLRSPSKEQLQSFSFEKLNNELRDTAPFLKAVLQTACVNNRNAKKPNEWMPTIGMAASVLLRNRSSRLNAVQLLLSIFLYHSSWTYTMARFKVLRLVVSHVHLYTKLHEFGKNYDASVKAILEQDTKWMASNAVNECNMDQIDSEHSDSDDSESDCEPATTADVPATTADVPATTADVRHPTTPSNGQKLTIDNIDYRKEVHYMTVDHQTEDVHYLTVSATTNRVHGNHLSSSTPVDSLKDMFNGSCIPNQLEQSSQRENYISLVEKTIVSNVPCMSFLKEVVPQHIPHQYSAETRSPTETSFLGVLFHNENEADGMNEIMKELHEYVPYHGKGGNRKYGDQAIVGDQLTVERGVNTHNTLTNGFTPKDRLEGLHFEMADWHGVNKSLAVVFSHLYSTASAKDKCTLYSDRNLINRRNVRADVESNVNACQRFFSLEVESRIVAACMTELGIGEFDETPSVLKVSDDNPWPREQKKEFVKSLAVKICDKYILDHQKHEKFITACQHADAKVHKQRSDVPANGRFKCRYPGCKMTFAASGQCRRNHEAKHIPPVNVPEENPTVALFFEDDPTKVDDMYNYQKSLMEIGMLIMNIKDAISEGDGARVVRCWKFLLLYLKNDNGSQKYSVEVIYLMFQINALLSPRSAHQLVWNRFTKLKSGQAGHISLDLNLEFFNKTVKQAIKKLGSNASRKSINRICQSINVTKALMENFDKEVKTYKTSGKHVRKSTLKDMKAVVAELIEQKALTRVPGRSYSYYSDIKSSMLAGFDLEKMYKWIDDHKSNIMLHRRAR